MSAKYDLQQLRLGAKDLRIELRELVSDFQLLPYDKLYNLFMIEEEIARFKGESRADGGRYSRVVLTNVGPQDVDVIRVIRTADIYSFAQALEIVNNAKALGRSVVVDGFSRVGAEEVAGRLREAGATAVVESYLP